MWYHLSPRTRRLPVPLTDPRLARWLWKSLCLGDKRLYGAAAFLEPGPGRAPGKPTPAPAGPAGRPGSRPADPRESAAPARRPS